MSSPERDANTSAAPQRPPPSDSWLEADVTAKSLLRRGLVVLVAVVVGAFWLGTRPGPPAAVDLVSPAEGSRIEGGSTLVWRSVPGAVTYQVELVAGDGRVLLSRETVDTMLSLGSEVTSPGAAQDVRWSVVARIPGGDVEWSGGRTLVVGGR